MVVVNNMHISVIMSGCSYWVAQGYHRHVGVKIIGSIIQFFIMYFIMLVGP